MPPVNVASTSAMAFTAMIRDIARAASPDAKYEEYSTVIATHPAPAMPVTARAANNVHGSGETARPSAPSAEAASAATANGFRRPIASAAIPIGMRRPTCAIAYAAITAPSMVLVAPRSSALSGRNGT